MVVRAVNCMCVVLLWVFLCCGTLARARARLPFTQYVHIHQDFIWNLKLRILNLIALKVPFGLEQWHRRARTA